MDFLTIAQNRQSCRKYDATRPVEPEKIEAILRSAGLAPSACNSQPYRVTVCTGESARRVAEACTSMGMNRFLADVPVLLVLSEENYNKTAAFGAKLKGNDYRSIDIGILVAYITAEATAQGLGSCIIGWLDDQKIRKVCDLDQPVRLVVSLGYAHPEDTLRSKKRKAQNEWVNYKG